MSACAVPSKKQVGVDKRLGYHTFQHGDLVRWTGGDDDQAPMPESVEAKEIYEECVFAVMLFSQRNQMRRYLITYDDTLSQFSINSWVGWTRVLKDGVAAASDVDDDQNVCRATPELRAVSAHGESLGELPLTESEELISCRS